VAGDWLKMVKDTPDKPEVMQIASILDCHPDSAFATCFRLWAWFDSHTKEGVTSGVTKVTLDALLHRYGFCDAAAKVGWLILHEDGRIELPNFSYHNSETAKTRALTALRASKHRKERDVERYESNGESVTPSVTSALRHALPEKRIEESNTPPVSPKGEPAPVQEVIDAYHRHMTDSPLVKVVTEARKRNIRARWEQTKTLELRPFCSFGADREAGLAAWDRFFKVCAQSDFLSNRAQVSDSHSNFMVDLDWMMNATNFVKILENKYTNERRAA
jgi:hypothetical protein